MDNYEWEVYDSCEDIKNPYRERYFSLHTHLTECSFYEPVFSTNMRRMNTGEDMTIFKAWYSLVKQFVFCMYPQESTSISFGK